MVCFEPLNAYLPFNEDSEGKRRLIFSPKIVNNMVRMSDISKKISFTKGDYFIEGTGYDDSRIIVAPDFHFSGELNGVITRIPCGKCNKATIILLSS